jgi:hypothetical protein
MIAKFEISQGALGRALGKTTEASTVKAVVHVKRFSLSLSGECFLMHPFQSRNGTVRC